MTKSVLPHRSQRAVFDADLHARLTLTAAGSLLEALPIVGWLVHAYGRIRISDNGRGVGGTTTGNPGSAGSGPCGSTGGAGGGQGIIATIPVGTRLYAAAVSLTGPDAGTVHIANNGSGTVSVFDPATNTVTATINVGANPYAVAVSPTRPGAGDVYVTTGRNTVNVIS